MTEVLLVQEWFSLSFLHQCTHASMSQGLDLEPGVGRE